MITIDDADASLATRELETEEAQRCDMCGGILDAEAAEAFWDAVEQKRVIGHDECGFSAGLFLA